MLNKKERTNKAIAALKQLYPDAKCSLTSYNALQLLIATRLSAQCTDARVNLITPALFERYTSLKDFSEAEVEEVESYIHSCGLYKTKARDIVAMTKMLRHVYNGVIPDTVDELIKLPGVGRKTANLIVGDVFGKPAVVTDTHCIRISNRLGLCNTKDPYKVEMELRDLLPPEESNAFCHRIVLFGRDICSARKPRCNVCPMQEYCPEYIAGKA
ncbi:MAG: endonuclease III [Oscillospiraceae bacterium]|nr:endonuclease III [Oscillospiraceae bacterium]MDD3832287.1 endonuclease III [Oscillospiraceae bacterium]MDD4547105.1 endonuclease III [Oscillospiraceae bacterium]